MKKTILCTTLCLAAASILPAQPRSEVEARTPVIYELFTSEGCSSCPPADRLLAMLDQKQPFANVDLIVLSEHVDYWNGGGWVDPYASKLFTKRQSRYAELFGLDSIYTPQRVVDGELEGVGGNAPAAGAAIQKAAAMKKITLQLSNVRRSGNHISFHLASADSALNSKASTLYVALAENRVQTSVRSGENAGRSLTHVAVVRALKPIASVNGGSSLSQDFTVEVPASAAGSFLEGMRLVAFLQLDETQHIIGATQARL